jgi:hypothetical protein
VRLRDSLQELTDLLEPQRNRESAPRREKAPEEDPDWATARTNLGLTYAQRDDGDRSQNWEIAIAAFEVEDALVSSATGTATGNYSYPTINPKGASTSLHRTVLADVWRIVAGSIVDRPVVGRFVVAVPGVSVSSVPVWGRASRQAHY